MSDDPSDNTARPASLPPWASLRYPSYGFLFLLSLFATTAQQMRQAQNFYQVYELSGSAFLLGLTGLAQGIPIFALGIFSGTLADFVDRKKLLLTTVLGNLVVAVTLGILTLSGAIHVWHILVGTALTSALNIILNPARMALGYLYGAEGGGGDPELAAAFAARLDPRHGRLAAAGESYRIEVE